MLAEVISAVGIRFGRKYPRYGMELHLDHVLVAVPDLNAAGREIEVRHGLSSIEGGRHPAWGTANRIVPLGDSYLELVAVVDAAMAAESVFGRWVMSGFPPPFGRLAGRSALLTSTRLLNA